MSSSKQSDNKKSLEELIQMGINLVEKERSATAIYQSLKANAASTEDLNAALEIVFEEPKTSLKKKYTPEVQAMLKANRIKMNFDYTVKSMLIIPLAVCLIGVITLILANERTNGNAPFAYWTLAEGFGLLVLFSIVRFKKQYDMLLIAALGFSAAYILQLLLLGIPNDLFAVSGVNGQASLKSKAFVVLVIGYLFPFIYLGLKIIVCLMVFTFYRRFRQFDNLSDQMKLDLIEFQAK